MAHLSRRIRQSLSPQPPSNSSTNEDQFFSPSDMTTTTTIPLPLQAGPRKLKKGDNVKNRMSMAFRKTFSKPPIPAQTTAKVVNLVAPVARQKLASSPSTSLPSYSAASSSPSRGYFGPAPEVVRQGSIGTATRESGRSNKPQTASTDGLVPRRSHVGAGAVGTSPPLPPIPLPSTTTVIYDGESAASTFTPSDGLGIKLDLNSSPSRFEDSSSSTTPRSTSSPQFPVLSNVSHAAPSSTPSVPVVEPLRFENSRDRLLRTRASISAPSEAVSKPRGANRAADMTKCYTLATSSPASDPISTRPPKSALRTKPITTIDLDSVPLPPPPPHTRVAAAWTSHSAPSSRKTSLATSSLPVPHSSSTLPSAGLYCLRPSVNASTQTPNWIEETRKSRRFSASTPPQAYSSMFAPPSVRHSYDITPPSPSVYSIASVETRGGAGHRKGESHSSFYAFKLTDQIKEGGEDEDLQAVIDRHLGELEQSERTPSLTVSGGEGGGYDVPFLDPFPYDTPQLRPFEIPHTPLAVPPTPSSTISPSQVPTPTLDRTPTLPSSRTGNLEISSPVVDPRPISPSTSSSTSHDASSSEGISTPPTSAASSTFEDQDQVVSIQLAEQEPIQIRKASLISSHSSRKSSLVACTTTDFSRRQSLHSRSSSISAKSVKFNLVEPTEPEEEDEEQTTKVEPIEYYQPTVVSPLRRRSESDGLVTTSRTRTAGVMSREERALKGRSFFLVQALMGEELPQEGMIRDWARDTEDEGETSEDEGSIADSEM
ncbi:hypothetical protein JCM5350_006220 [Sporobolomyces pararoseus]